MSIRTQTAGRGALRAVLGCGIALVLAGRAQAHPQAAQTPVFVAPSECVTVVDKRTAPMLAMSYTLPFDDVEITSGDIPVSDAKTHQFFAFAAAIHPAALFYEAHPFDALRAPRVIPEWISVDDVMRSLQATPSAQDVVFDANSVALDSVLENDAALSGLWQTITRAQQRVPITIAQAGRGVNWDLAAVPAGLYTVAGYVFSPPFNAWSVRPGLVKVVDGGPEPPALVVSPIDAFVFQYQGRRIGLCASVPESTRLTAYFRIVGQAASSWTPFAEQPIATGRSELCFRAPATVAGAAVRLRFDLRTPGGANASFYSPDALTPLQGEGRCSAGETVCCDFPQGPAPGGAGGSAGGMGGAPSPVPPSEPASSGCRVEPMQRPDTPLWLLAFVPVARRARRRR